MNSIIEDKYTVADYLKQRMEEIGVQQMFGVAGNYTAALLDTILADADSPIKISGNANEVCAGFAADAYARLKGVGALYVTYSVGAFSILNTIAGSFVEQVPVMLINGAPTNKEVQMSQQAGLLYAHTTGYQFLDIHMFRPITVAAERIVNAAQAPFQIDSAITAMLTHKRPIYLEVTEDVWRTPCQRPQIELHSGVYDTITISSAAEAAKATVEIMLSRPKSIFWAGIELQRYGLQDKFLELLSLLNQEQIFPEKEIHFITSAMSKSVISETHKWFAGCVTLSNKKIDSIVGEDGVLIGLGAWTTGKDTSNQDIRSDRTILSAHDGVHVGANYYPSVRLSDYLDELVKYFSNISQTNLNKLSGCRLPNVNVELLGTPPLTNTTTLTNTTIGYDEFFSAMSNWITEDDIMVVDAGFSLIGAQNVKIPSQNGFIAQASWLSIGYSVPAGTGIKCACPDKRAIVVLGDGAFQETCQAIGDQHAYGHNTVVFVIANGIYGIEQYLVNPNPFRETPIRYNDKLLDDVYGYNLISKWKIDKLADGFGGKGRVVNTLEELTTVMQEIRQCPDDNFLVEVKVPETSVPLAIAKEAKHAVGEDEIENPNWPPKGKF